MSKQQEIPSVPEKMREKHDAIAAMIDGFSHEHLNEEYRLLCRRMAGVLARKRPSPLVNGTPAAWAAGIVRAVGWVNFLDDKTQKPYIKFTEVDKAFGISPATGAAKSKAIRDLLKINAFDADWTLPSRMADNPMIWMIQVNGLILDARHVPREIQEEAYRKGIIPYIPADGPVDGSGEQGE
ncbi:MAG: hypothetical protein JWO87_1286 [Phycisphaerales bacterium]|nr:hypothetical protein [Phycisphaerales bacterium]